VQQFDRAESGVMGRRETVPERIFAEQHVQVRRKPKHNTPILTPWKPQHGKSASLDSWRHCANAVWLN
jgi:hypothetical protein